MCSKTVIVLVALLGCSRGQEQAPKQAPTKTVVITGALVSDKGAPLSGSHSATGCGVEAQACVAVVRVKGSRPSGQDATNVDIETITSSRGVEPDKAGRFRIEIDRRLLLSGANFMLVTMSLFSGMEPLRLNAKFIVFEIDDKTQSLDLGRITVTNK